jgi:asparagine synthetase B (glutamine-hydrolysing)
LSHSVLTIEGTPILSGRILSVQDLPEINAGSLDRWIALAQKIRGQFSIIAKAGEVSIAVTDLTGSFPLFVNNRGVGGAFALSLGELTLQSSSPISDEGISRYAALGTVGPDRTLVSGVCSLPGASIGICNGTGSGVKTSSWLNWSALDWSTALAGPSNVADHNAEFEGIFDSWVQANLPQNDRVGLLLSGGTDSTLLAALLKPLLGDRLVCITQDFFARRYSERDAAIETAQSLHLPILTAQIGRAHYYRAFKALNAKSQDAAVHSSQTQNLFCLAEFARKQEIHTLISGEHADSLFLGFGHFFKDFPADLKGYLDAISHLTVKDKLDWVVGRPDITRLTREILKAFGIPRGEFDRCIHEVFAARRRCFEPLAPLVDMPTLQQLAGQIDGGVGWREIGLPVMRAFPGCRILCPFFDSDVVKFALKLPPDLKYRDGQTKYFLRQLLKTKTGFERPKRPAALSPLRFWRILPDPGEYFAVSGGLRSLYRRLTLQNLRRSGALYNELARVAALGIWLKSHHLAARQSEKAIPTKSLI